MTPVESLTSAFVQVRELAYCEALECALRLQAAWKEYAQA